MRDIFEKYDIFQSKNNIFGKNTPTGKFNVQTEKDFSS